MSYIIESSLNAKFSNVFYASAAAFLAAEQPHIGNRQTCKRQFSDHFRAPRLLPPYKHKPCLKPDGLGLQNEATPGLYQGSSQRQPCIARDLQQRFIADQTVRERLRRY
ncbi:hypothetical protein [Pseudomonas putida]|uniref:hypothetical protein n=1 Tax=Pseudomonas putida TaxID=303 RepID=UPI0005BC1321|nr:hypothetical protein [Pseudomonas putida]